MNRGPVVALVLRFVGVNLDIDSAISVVNAKVAAHVDAHKAEIEAMLNEVGATDVKIEVTAY